MDPVCGGSSPAIERRGGSTSGDATVGAGARSSSSRAGTITSWVSPFARTWIDFDHRLRLSQLRYVCSSRAAATTLAENYVGLEAV